jgi:hypothetical protein
MTMSMNFFPLLVAAVAVLPFLGLAGWIWFVAADTRKALVSFDFEGMHFED